MTDTILIILMCLVALSVIYFVVTTSHKHSPRPFCLLPTDDSKWKKIVELHYTNNVLTVVTFDHNVKEFYNDGIAWLRYPSRTIIKDQVLINSLNKCYDLVKDKLKNGEGWVKVF